MMNCIHGNSCVFVVKIIRIFLGIWIHQAVPTQPAAAAAPQTSRVVSESAEAENNSWERQRLQFFGCHVSPG